MWLVGPILVCINPKLEPQLEVAAQFGLGEKMSWKQGRFEFEVPHEILATELLPRLPPKSLLRFQSVCKAWKDLISDPVFISTQLLKYKSQGASISDDGTITSSHQHLNILARVSHQFSLCLIVVRPGTATTKSFGYEDFPLMRNPRDHPFYPCFWNSCNGLICVEFLEDELSLWNPCTQSYTTTTLPRWNTQQTESFPKLAYLFRRTFGFGYDAKIRDYKVVRIAEKRGENVRRIETHVITRGANSWRKVLGNEDFFSPERGRFVNGFLYWKSMDGGSNKIFRFDIHDEVFSYVKLPDVLVDEEAYYMRCGIEIGELGGCLALVRDYGAANRTPDVCHELWVMKENWVKMYSISIPRDIYIQFRTPFVPVGSVSISKKKNDVEIVYVSNDGYLLSYNPNTNLFRSMKTEFYRDLVPTTVVTYVESLVLLDKDA